MKILYLVHDLDDPAVRRRTEALLRGGAEIVLAGFRRGPASATPLATVRVVELGRTINGRLGRRVFSLLGAILRSRRWHTLAHDASIMMARSLEMLTLAALIRGRSAPGIPLVYECLDIHRLMTDRRAVGRCLRALEGRLLGRTALLVTSSNAFVERYFRPAHPHLPPHLILENKLLAHEVAAASVTAPQPEAGTPWRIGWFGVIRCRRSLALLAELVRRHPGLVEVEIRGRPARDVIADFDQVVAATPGLRFHGPYDRSRDLPRIYGDVHFTWAIDFYEDGANSAWLLPNRLYEGSLYGAVPLALRHVETGRWLARHGCGVLFEEPLQAALAECFVRLDAASYREMQRAVRTIAREALVETEAGAVGLVSRLGALAAAPLLHA